MTRRHRAGRTEPGAGDERRIPADAVVLAVGRWPNTAIFRDLDLAADRKRRIAVDFR